MKPDPTHAEMLMSLAKLEMGCHHTDAQWIPDDPNRAGCEDGKWRCLQCGAERKAGYRPLLEHWEGGKGKAVRFPTLRQVCRCVYGGEAGGGRGFPNLCDGINHWLDLGGCKPCYLAGKHLPDCFCQGRGWVPVDSLEATTKDGKVYEWMLNHPDGRSDVNFFLDFIHACGEGDNVGAIDAVYEAVKAEGGEE